MSDATRTLSRLAAALAIAGMLVGTSGCKKLLRKGLADAGTSTTGATTDPNATPQDNADDQLSDKLDEFIKCQNLTSSTTWSERKHYLSQFKTAPTGHETTASISTLPKDSATTCTTNTAKGKTMPPKLADLESAGDDYASAIASVDNILNQLSPYFENRDYRDDKWAKGKTLDPQLRSAFDAFRKADTNLHNAIAAQSKPLNQRMLARIEREDGKKFGWNRLNTLNSGRDLIDATDPPGEDDDIDFALYTSSEDAFEKALDSLKTYGAAHKSDLENQKLARHWPLAGSNYDQFVSTAEDYRKSAKTLMRCMRDAPAVAKTGGKIDLDKMKSCPDGVPMRLQSDAFHKFNLFVRQANSGRFP